MFISPIAQKMYDESPKLRLQFEEKLKTDSTFAKNSRARLNFFYERSPYYDKKYNVYPIMRVVE